MPLWEGRFTSLKPACKGIIPVGSPHGWWRSTLGLLLPVVVPLWEHLCTLVSASVCGGWRPRVLGGIFWLCQVLPTQPRIDVSVWKASIYFSPMLRQLLALITIHFRGPVHLIGLSLAGFGASKPIQCPRGTLVSGVSWGQCPKLAYTIPRDEETGRATLLLTAGTFPASWAPFTPLG